jgi:hypothetical protein
MKRIAMMIAAMTLAVPAPLMVSTPALADSSNSSRYVPPFCENIIALYPGMPLGECVSLEESSYQYFARGSDAFATHWCALLRDVYPDDYEVLFGSSWTDCVHFAHEAIAH